MHLIQPFKGHVFCSTTSYDLNKRHSLKARLIGISPSKINANPPGSTLPVILFLPGAVVHLIVCKYTSNCIKLWLCI